MHLPFMFFFVFLSTDKILSCAKINFIYADYYHSFRRKIFKDYKGTKYTKCTHIVPMNLYEDHAILMFLTSGYKFVG